MKALLKKVLPDALLKYYRRWRLLRQRRVNAQRPISAVFSEIYERNQWGGSPGDFWSGSGSTDSQTMPYAKVVREFVQRHDVRTIVDLGCGDYRVGRMLRTPGVRYLGVDIVHSLIERNRALFADEEVEFFCRNMLEDDLPAGDLCLVRQVLQHLSNREITTVLSRLSQYPYVLVTEHYPALRGVIPPNLDKPHGPDTRIVDNSGVFLDQAPFSCTICEVVLELPVEHPLVSPGETLRTLLLTGPALRARQS